MRYWVLLLAAGVCASNGAEFKLRWIENHVEAHGFSAKALASLQRTNTPGDWQRLLAVHAGQNNSQAASGLPAMAGTYRVEKGKVRFDPQFPLSPNVTYTAVLNTADSSSLVARHRITAAPPPSTTTVTAIYPSAATVPENLLKFYIHFSAPMSGGRVYEHISLRDSSGKAVELPFLEIDEELWNPQMTRLTLFLDPGRIKRGLRPLEEIGPSFVAGKNYSLTIASTWLDARGAPLKSGFQKSFAITAADREPPDPAQWKVTAPRAKTREMLKLEFNEPLDHGILQRTVAVRDAQNQAVPGEVKLENQEELWTFKPERAWRAGVYHIQIPTRIEDLAGNNIGKPFDVDLAEGQRQITEEFVRLQFEIR